MKYKAIIETDDYVDFEFFEDGNGKYMICKDASPTVNGGWMSLYFTECKQEPILDKIRAEIEQVANQEKVHDEKWALGLRYAVNIIEKYKAESEGCMSDA